MAQQPLKVRINGIPTMPNIKEINARPDATTVGDIAFKLPVNETDYMVIDVKEDLEKKTDDNGKIYQWFQAQFPAGTAWVRADLVKITGDGSTVGYGVIASPTIAQTLTRQANTVPHGAETQSPSTTTEVSAPATAPSTASEVSAPATAPSTATEVSAPATAPSTATEVSAPATAPSTATEVSAPAVPSGPPMITAASAYPAKLRPGPGTGHNPPIVSIPKGGTAEFLEAKMGDDGKPLYWVKCNYQGQVGWTREDLVRLSGNFPEFGLNASDRYPNPAPQSHWVRGWDQNNSIWNTGKHDGWDHAGDVGAPLLAGPQGGIVYAKVDCAKCGPQGKSTQQAGIPLYSPSIYSDPGWNYGYGHYIIIGYENSKLPASTKAYLESEGRAGQHIFVMYAHCHQLLVEKGTQLSPNQQFATLGNSGMSTGAHLHLEVRISPTMAPARWAVLKDGLRSPGILFLR